MGRLLEECDAPARRGVSGVRGFWRRGSRAFPELHLWGRGVPPGARDCSRLSRMTHFRPLAETIEDVLVGSPRGR